MNKNCEQDKGRVLKIKLTNEQREEIAKFIHETGRIDLDIDIGFEAADIRSGSIAASTFMVGAAV